MQRMHTSCYKRCRLDAHHMQALGARLMTYRSVSSSFVCTFPLTMLFYHQMSPALHSRVALICRQLCTSVGRGSFANMTRMVPGKGSRGIRLRLLSSYDDQFEVLGICKREASCSESRCEVGSPAADKVALVPRCMGLLSPHAPTPSMREQALPVNAY